MSNDSLGSRILDPRALGSRMRGRGVRQDRVVRTVVSEGRT